MCVRQMEIRRRLSGGAVKAPCFDWVCISCEVGLFSMGEAGECPVEEGSGVEASPSEKDGWQDAAPGKVDQVTATDGDPRQYLIRCFVDLTGRCAACRFR